METLEATELRETLYRYGIAICDDITDNDIYTQQEIIHRLIKWLHTDKEIETRIKSDDIYIRIFKFKRDFYKINKDNTEELAIQLFIEAPIKFRIPKFFKNVLVHIDEYAAEYEEYNYTCINIEDLSSMFPLLGNYNDIIVYMEHNNLKIETKDNKYYSLVEKYRIQEIKETIKYLNPNSTIDTEASLLLLRPTLDKLDYTLNQHIDYLNINEHTEEHIRNLEIYKKNLYENTQPNHQAIENLLQQYIDIIKQLNKVKETTWELKKDKKN